MGMNEPYWDDTDEGYYSAVFDMIITLASKLVSDFVNNKCIKRLNSQASAAQTNWGHEWQKGMFGGVIENYEIPGHDLGPYQGGMLMLKQGGKSFEITRASVRKAVEWGKSCFRRGNRPCAYFNNIHEQNISEFNDVYQYIRLGKETSPPGRTMVEVRKAEISIPETTVYNQGSPELGKETQHGVLDSEIGNDWEFVEYEDASEYTEGSTRHTGKRKTRK